MSNKYDFSGIKKAGAAGLKALLASTPWGTWLVTGFPGTITTFILELFTGYLANRGLMIMNVGAIFFDGHVDPYLFDMAMDGAIKEVENSGGKLTKEQIERIDNAVIEAARKLIVIGNRR